jgi:hypothetical protein
MSKCLAVFKLYVFQLSCFQSCYFPADWVSSSFNSTADGSYNRCSPADVSYSCCSPADGLILLLFSCCYFCCSPADWLPIFIVLQLVVSYSYCFPAGCFFLLFSNCWFPSDAILQLMVSNSCFSTPDILLLPVLSS